MDQYLETHIDETLSKRLPLDQYLQAVTAPPRAGDCWVCAGPVMPGSHRDLITAQGETQARIPEWGAHTWPVTIPIMEGGAPGHWWPPLSLVSLRVHFLITGGVMKQHRNLSPEADCVKCPVSLLQSPDSGHYYWCHLSLVFTLI